MIRFHWKPASLLKRLSAPEKMASWLMTPGSLTRRIRQACPDMQLEVLSEGWQLPLTSEALALGLAPHEKTWVRCIVMKCDQRTWVYARTIVPAMQPGHPWHSIQTLGDQPLGELLFELKEIQRSEFEFNRQSIDAWPLLAGYLGETASRHYDETCFARRSLFWQQQTPLLLTEVFLSPILDD